MSNLTLKLGKSPEKYSNQNEYYDSNKFPKRNIHIMYLLVNNNISVLLIKKTGQYKPFYYRIK